MTHRKDLAGEGREQGEHLQAGLWTRSTTKGGITFLACGGNSVTECVCIVTAVGLLHRMSKCVCAFVWE